MTLFTKPSKHDVYIYAPPYKRASAGVTVLYLLCDCLNRLGIQSWIVPDPKYFGVFGYSSFAGAGNLITPVANIHALKKGVYESRIPVVIYPETIYGNPLEFSNIVRYLLYYNSELENFDSLETLDKEGVVYYSNEIGEKSLINKGQPLFSGRLTIPVQDPGAFKREPKEYRSGNYYYAEKYINVHGLTVPGDIASNATRITRDQGDSPSPDQLVALLSRAKLLHVFEDTALIYEALLAGCVVNIHPDGRYGSNAGPATKDELGKSGLMSSKNITDDCIKNAQHEIESHLENYHNWMKVSTSDINNFVNNLSTFTSTYNEEIILKLISRIESVNRYTSELIVSEGKVKEKTLLTGIIGSIKKMIPKRHRSRLLENAKRLGRKAPPKLKPLLIKILISVCK